MLSISAVARTRAKMQPSMTAALVTRSNSNAHVWAPCFAVSPPRRAHNCRGTKIDAAHMCHVRSCRSPGNAYGNCRDMPVRAIFWFVCRTALWTWPQETHLTLRCGKQWQSGIFTGSAFQRRTCTQLLLAQRRSNFLVQGLRTACPRGALRMNVWPQVPICVLSPEPGPAAALGSSLPREESPERVRSKHCPIGGVVGHARGRTNGMNPRCSLRQVPQRRQSAAHTVSEARLGIGSRVGA
jgi:hypothetical protein